MERACERLVGLKVQIGGYQGISGLYRDNGKENGNYYSILGLYQGILGLYRDNGKENGNYSNGVI